jgi:hypothetical protein
MNFSILKAYPCKLPFEQRGIGDGYATSGPVTTYKLPPEEIKRIFAQAEKPREKPPIVFRDPRKRKDDDTVANRLERAREKLTREQYIQEKADGKSDADIMYDHFGECWNDTISTLKKEWGLLKLKQAQAREMIEIHNSNPDNIPPDEINQAVKVDITAPEKKQFTVLALVLELDKLSEEVEALTEEASIKNKRAMLIKAALENTTVEL